MTIERIPPGHTPGPQEDPTGSLSTALSTLAARVSALEKTMSRSRRGGTVMAVLLALALIAWATWSVLMIVG